MRRDRRSLPTLVKVLTSIIVAMLAVIALFAMVFVLSGMAEAFGVEAVSITMLLTLLTGCFTAIAYVVLFT